jgi:hypothetical protein
MPDWTWLAQRRVWQGQRLAMPQHQHSTVTALGPTSRQAQDLALRRLLGPWSQQVTRLSQQVTGRLLPVRQLLCHRWAGA